MNALARSRAKEELRLFTLGALLGTAFVIGPLFVVQGVIGGILMFVWVASRIEYLIAASLVVDLVMRPKERGAPRFLPVTALTLGAALPIVLVSLRYLF